ncbi:MAG: LytTR family DNA-binding domain-containing protein [Bacteroidales bacterium]|nr:LytTR family DNA-binding domain-containing protein [Bacteroidales bacterium]
MILFLGTCLLVALIVFVCQWRLIPVSTGLLLLDGLLFAALFGLISVLLWYVVHFADLSGTNKTQKIINYSALIVLILVAWIGTGYLLIMLFFPEDVFYALTKGIPMKVVLGIFVYTSNIRLYLKAPQQEDLFEDNPEYSKDKPELHQSGVANSDENPVSTRKWFEKISVKVGQKIHVIPTSEMIFLQAEGDYVIIHTALNHFIKEQTMKYFEENLSPEKYVRIHRSTIVNIDVISRIELYEKQNYRITLKSGHQLKASASGYKLLKNTLKI